MSNREFYKNSGFLFHGDRISFSKAARNGNDPRRIECYFQRSRLVRTYCRKARHGGARALIGRLSNKYPSFMLFALMPTPIRTHREKPFAIGSFPTREPFFCWRNNATGVPPSQNAKCQVVNNAAYYLWRPRRQS